MHAAGSRSGQPGQTGTAGPEPCAGGQFAIGTGGGAIGNYSLALVLRLPAR